jgi:hypothetical protein
LLVDPGSALAKEMGRWWALYDKIYDLKQLFEDVDTLWKGRITPPLDEEGPEDEDE